MLPSLDHFKKAYNSSSTSENDKFNIVWMAMRYEQETSPVPAVMEFMNRAVVKLDESSAVVADFGEKRMVEGRHTIASVFHERVSAFVKGYRCALAKSECDFLENIVLMLRGEGFRSLEKAAGGAGCQEIDLKSSCHWVIDSLLNNHQRNKDSGQSWSCRELFRK